MQPKKVTVVGIGYVGLPLAVLACEKGWQVIGLDIDRQKVEQVNEQRSPLRDEALAEALQRFPIRATTDPAMASDSSVIVIAVPTPVTEEHLPDLEPLLSAVTNLLPHLKNGQTLIVESTINPGVMDEMVVPLLRKRNDLRLENDPKGNGEPLYLVHCPERINPGDAQWTVRNIPRVVGGYSSAGIKRAVQFYDSILEAPVKVMASVTEAEAVKILENTFRDINIAFINEMAQSFARLDVDIIHVIEGASTKPFAFLPHYPGNGVGGHCISIDPYYMIERAREVGFDHQFLKLARQINDSMPLYSVTLLEEGLREQHKKLPGATIALLGLTYKKNIADLRESPALKVRQLLGERGAHMRVFDPYVPKHSTVGSLDEALVGCDALMLACDHAVFVKELTPKKIKHSGISLVIDGKNALNADGIAAAGIPYRGIGRARMPR